MANIQQKINIDALQSEVAASKQRSMSVRDEKSVEENVGPLNVIHRLVAHGTPEQLERAERRLAHIMRRHGNKPEFAWVHRIKDTETDQQIMR